MKQILSLAPMWKRACSRQQNNGSVCQSFFLLALGLVCGCSDTRWNSAGFRNPFASKTDAYKSQYGLSSADRIRQLESLTEKPTKISSAQLPILAQQLTDTIANDADSLVRRAAIRLLAQLPDEFALPGMREAAQNSDHVVRQLAIEGWSERITDEAVSVLTGALRNDGHLDVQLAAAKGLANFNSSTVIQALSTALEYQDPAIQFRAAQSLAQVTGQNLGTDITAWQRFLADSVSPSDQMTKTPQPLTSVR